MLIRVVVSLVASQGYVSGAAEFIAAVEADGGAGGWGGGKG